MTALTATQKSRKKMAQTYQALLLPPSAITVRMTAMSKLGSRIGLISPRISEPIFLFGVLAISVVSPRFFAAARLGGSCMVVGSGGVRRSCSSGFVIAIGQPVAT